MPTMMTLTNFRANLYNFIDKVISTGKPIEIERHGYIVKIIAEKPKNKLDNLKAHPGTIIGNPDDIVSS